MKAERNKEILNNFLSSSTEEYQTMVNALLAFWNGYGQIGMYVRGQSTTIVVGCMGSVSS